MHETSEGNACAAQKVDAFVTEIFLHLERQNEAVNQFHDEVVKIPQIVSDIKNVMAKIGEMEVLFSEVNEGLADLADVLEEHRLLRDMHQHHTQLKLYAQKQKGQVEKLRTKMSADHAFKVQVHEAKLQDTLREKQEAIQEAFSEEMQNYRKFGQTQFKPSEKKDTECSLADINIDEGSDSSELDDFLRSQEITDVPNSTSGADKSEEEEDVLLGGQVEVKTDQDFVANES
ncbi:hypothetical protein CAPTEDRAFT_204927 [Capitella teleta]|uniref:Uncharacterized protein n=1 Tax=Capitella teleta TaxID=283909 RepID=R7TPB4_CAPTE|nr:hypothetical protein CAPTEDRAFT_204927 [Capitella teleta]|eukprot:ELT92880.1 hypothetical protein CAPTEDRAFT_204927 [Capitella teleta]